MAAVQCPGGRRGGWRMRGAGAEGVASSIVNRRSLGATSRKSSTRLPTISAKRRQAGDVAPRSRYLRSGPCQLALSWGRPFSAAIVDAEGWGLLPLRSLYSITSSARASSAPGTSRPSTGGRLCTGIRPTCSAALAWPGLTAPPAPAHPVGRSVEHPGSGIVRSPGGTRGTSGQHRCSGKDRHHRK